MAQAPARRATRSPQTVSASDVSRLEREVENLQNALTRQEFSIRKGYICTIYDAGEGTFIGSCPTLHAGSQGHTHDAASQELDEAIDAVFEAFEELGRPLPARDTETRCRD